MIDLKDVRDTHRMRQDLLNAEGRLWRQTRAICTRSIDKDGKEKKEIYAEGAVLFEAILKDNGHISAIGTIVSASVLPLVTSYEVIRRERKLVQKSLVAMASQFPVADWVENKHGIGILGVGQIIGETGDLNNYANPAKLWKRMGLHVIEGERAKKKRGKEGIAQEYSPRRRAVAWNIGDAVIRSGKGEYYEMYLKRKEYESTKEPDFNKGWWHNRAKRYMEKQFLKDLWQEWRRSS